MTEQQSFDSLFAREDEKKHQEVNKDVWKILLVDDEEDMHVALHLTLQAMEVEGRTLQLFDAKSAKEAKTLLAEHPDIALILLDVVMESGKAGLDFVKHIRQGQSNTLVQIILITGQPGYAPQREVVTNYAINGYCMKSELSADKIFVTVYAALRTHQVMLNIEHQYQLLSRWDNIFDQAEWGIAVGCADGKSLELCNPAFARLHGYSVEEVLALQFPDLFTHEEQAILSDHINKAHERGHYNFESWHRRKDGSTFPVLVDVSAVKDEQGQVLYRVVNVQDITKRKADDKALQLTQFSMDNAADAIFWVSKGAVYVYANTAASRLLGYSRDDFSRLKISDINPAHQKEKWDEHWEQLRQRKIMTFEAELRCKNGLMIEVEISANYFQFEGEELNCAFVRDISARKKVEREIQKVATEWSAAMDALPDLIYLLDLNHRVIRANRAFYECTGLTAETSIGRHINTIFKAQTEMNPFMGAVPNEKKKRVYTLEVDSPDNPIGKPIEISSIVVKDTDEKPVSILFILHDVSTERNLQQKLADYRLHLEKLVKTRTGELEEKNAELQRLNKLFVGRENRMIELKEKIQELEKQARSLKG